MNNVGIVVPILCFQCAPRLKYDASYISAIEMVALGAFEALCL
ncbi:MAG TPA: hypothetical protein VMG30_11565 [Acidobacteriota bacterium]|nr:hypothetical protein [Acidobacteriota bacterium]